MKMTTPTAIGVSAAVAKPLKSRRSGEATRAAVSDHMFTKSLEVADFCWDLPAHIAKRRYLQHSGRKYSFT